MANYFIGFDLPLTANEDTRKPMTERIYETFGATHSAQVTNNGWLIHTDWEPEAVHSWLRMEVHPARVVVIRMTGAHFLGPPDSRLPVWVYSDDTNPSEL